MKRRNLIVLGAALGAAIVAGSVTVVAATVGDDDENSAPITGEALERASAAALAHTGGGRVTETEVGDEESMYEVEVTMPDGSQVDVQLDESFKVVGDKREAAGSDDDD
jgi:uncharacterized membrane protein YkoI